MSLKPAVMRDVPANAVAMKKVLGPKLGNRFAVNPTSPNAHSFSNFPTARPPDVPWLMR